MVGVFFAGPGKQISRLYNLHLLLWKASDLGVFCLMLYEEIILP